MFRFFISLVLQEKVSALVKIQSVRSGIHDMLNERNLSPVPIVSADLRVNPGTQFSFTCVRCRATVNIALDWILNSSSPASEPFQPSELQALDLKYGGVFRPVRCNDCQTLYLVREDIQETSMCAYRIRIDAVWKVSEPPA